MEMNEHELRLRFAESRLRACESLKQRLEKEIAELKAATVEEPPPKKRSIGKRKISPYRSHPRRIGARPTTLHIVSSGLMALKSLGVCTIAFSLRTMTRYVLSLDLALRNCVLSSQNIAL
jgi:hypothetical protein